MLDSKLYTFLMVAKKRSFTAAAEELHLTQPAVTQQIKKLEEYYQCRFIEIKGRAVFLTEAGEALLYYANMQLTNEEQLKRKIEKISNPIQIGATLSIADYYLPSYLIEMMRKKQYAIQLTVGNTTVLLKKLIQGELDCALIEGIFDTGLFESKLFCKTQFIPAVAADHPLVGKKIQFHDLFSFPLVLREVGSGTRAVLENYLYEKNTSVDSFEEKIEIGSFGAIKQLIRFSQGITFLYENVIKKEKEQGELATLDIVDFHIERKIPFVYLKNSISKRKYETFYLELLEGKKRE